MKKEPIFIAFSTQKGGVGKSAMTTIVASMLHYRMGYNVAVFDCDYPQWSVAKTRERDMKLILENERFKRQAYNLFTDLNKKAYPVISCRADEAVKKADTFLKDASIEYDFLFFDMPGTINSAGILETLSQMNFIFTPIIADRLVLDSSLSFFNVLNTVMVKTGGTKIKSIYLFWNMVDGREKSELYAHYENVIKQLDLQIMSVFIPDTKRFRKEMSADAENRLTFRSTLFPVDKRLLKSSRIEEFIGEFLEIVKK